MRFLDVAKVYAASGAGGNGCIAFRQTNATFPGVSFPSSVVRSIIEMTSLRPESLAEVLMLRLANAAARSSTMI